MIVLTNPMNIFPVCQKHALKMHIAHLQPPSILLEDYLPYCLHLCIPSPSSHNAPETTLMKPRITVFLLTKKRTN